MNTEKKTPVFDIPPSDLQQDDSSLREKVNDQRAFISDLLDERARQSELLQKIIGSKSWQWTAPIRSAEEKIRYELGRFFSILKRNLRLYGKSSHFIAVRSDSAAVKRLFSSGFDRCSAPKISILIPVFGRRDWTTACLISIQETVGKHQCEVILIDDGSKEEDYRDMRNIPGLRYLRNDINLGYLSSVNIAAKQAVGDYLVLLNNDVIVQPGWLDALGEIFCRYPNAGMAGAKLIYPDGLLQEAGCEVSESGFARNVGRGDHPDKSCYQFVKSVDYCSAACVMIPRELFSEVGGYDSYFAPAYYEDVDLAFKIRELGRGVYYQPLCRVFHAEGATCGRDQKRGTKQYQEINRHKFVKKWAKVLKRDDGGQSQDKQPSMTERILVVDAAMPTPDRDAGSKRMFEILKLMQSFGYQVAFADLGLSRPEPYTKDLQQMGIEVIARPEWSSVKEFLKSRGSEFNIVWISRVNSANQCMQFVSKYAAGAKIIFDTVDLHHVREMRQAEIGQNAAMHKKALVRQREEFDAVRKSDWTVAVSGQEAGLIRSFVPTARVQVVSLAEEEVEQVPAWQNRKDIVFLGGFRHQANGDALQWFIHEIFPLVMEDIPEAKLCVIGSDLPQELRKYESGRIQMIGYVPRLTHRLKHFRVGIVPLRFGAGVKGKIVTMASHGVPVVASRVAAEGMMFESMNSIWVEDDPREFANAIMRLYLDPDMWDRLSEGGRQVVKDFYSVKKMKTDLKTVLKEIGKM